MYFTLNEMWWVNILFQFKCERGFQNRILSENEKVTILCIAEKILQPKAYSAKAIRKKVGG